MKGIHNILLMCCKVLHLETKEIRWNNFPTFEGTSWLISSCALALLECRSFNTVLCEQSASGTSHCPTSTGGMMCCSLWPPLVLCCTGESGLIFSFLIFFFVFLLSSQSSFCSPAAAPCGALGYDMVNCSRRPGRLRAEWGMEWNWRCPHCSNH